MSTNNDSIWSKLFKAGEPINVSRRGFLKSSAGLTATAFVMGVGLTPGVGRAAAQSDAAPGTVVPAFLEILPDNTIRFQSPFIEGGQGIFTAMAQIVGEELDADPSRFIVECARADKQYMVMNGGAMRITGGSMSVRYSYDTMRRLGAMARSMLLDAAAQKLGVSVASLTTDDGKVVHAASGKSLTYGELSDIAMDMNAPVADKVALKDPSTFKWIRKPVKRIDVYDKSTGKAQFSIDMMVDDMLHAAVQHAPRLGLDVGDILNEEKVLAMPGVHSVHRLKGAVAVVAKRWWHANKAAQSLQVEWKEPTAELPANVNYMPADFSTAGFIEKLASAEGQGVEGESKGDARGVLNSAENVISATYHSQYVHHAQLEPPSALARFNQDGSLDLWLPNQAPEQFRTQAAKLAGLDETQVNIHSPLLGGFFGRHFLYETGNPYPQAIELAKKIGKPIKLIWSREQEFLRDVLRPIAAVKFRATLDDEGMPVAIEAISATEGPTEGLTGKHNPEKLDPAALEGLAEKPYNIPNVRIAQNFVKNPTMLGYWRSVGNSMNDFLYESFLDELADTGNNDPYELRKKLLQGNQRQTNLLEAVIKLAGGWKRGPFTAEDGSKRARGLAMASPFGSHTAAIAEVSIKDGKVVVHEVWQAIDPGSIVNPAIIDAQINSATALGTSQVLMEHVVYENGEQTASNYDMYPIINYSQMPKVNVQIVESGEKMGGIGEPGLPAVPPAVANAVSHLTGKRVRSMPLSELKFDS